MKNIIFIVSGYYPYYSAVGKCIANVANALDDETQVTVISTISKTYQKRIEKYGMQTIVRVSTRKMEQRIEIEEKLGSTKGIMKKFLFIKYFLARADHTIRMISSKESVEENLITAYLNALNQLNQSIDIIMPVCGPFDTIVAAMRYKNNHLDVKIVPYLFDQFAASETLHRTYINKQLKMKRNLMLEQKMMEKSSIILYVPTWSNNIHKYFSSWLERGREVEHPLIIKPPTSVLLSELGNRAHIMDVGEGCIVVFAGSLINNYVEPDYILKLLAQTSKTTILVRFYSAGNACGRIKRARLPNVKNYGWVSHEILLHQYNSANILLNIA